MPKGVIHSLQNLGEFNLGKMEIQFVSYLDEGDIIRFENLYGRIK